MLREDLKNQTVPQACVTPPAVGRQTRCGPGNNWVTAKRENMPAGGRQHRARCSNLPPSFASPAWKLSRPGAIWSSLRWLYPSAQQLSSSDNHAVVRRTTYSTSKIEKKKKRRLSAMHVEKIATQGASEESVLCITMSHFSSYEKVSLSGDLWGDFQEQAMPPEPLRQPRETTAGDCTVIKKTRDPWNLQWLQSIPVSGLQTSQSCRSPHLMDVVMREQK